METMQKTPELFDGWNEKKKEIEFVRGSLANARVGEFWRYREGVNIGNEISKDGLYKRVCLVLHNALGNGLLLVAPLTTKYHKRMDAYYVKIDDYRIYGLKESWIIINQIKMIDKKRLFKKTAECISSTGFAKKVRCKYGDLIANKKMP